MQQSDPTSLFWQLYLDALEGAGTGKGGVGDGLLRPTIIIVITVSTRGTWFWISLQNSSPRAADWEILLGLLML